MTVLEFPYQKDFTGNLFPVVDVFVNNGGQVVGLLALIDSGATISVFKEDVAEQLNLTIEEGEQIYLGGVGGRIKGYIHKLEMTIGSKHFICPVVFSREYLVSFNLLGRQGFFEKFKVVFEESKQLVTLE